MRRVRRIKKKMRRVRHSNAVHSLPPATCIRDTWVGTRVAGRGVGNAPHKQRRRSAPAACRRGHAVRAGDAARAVATRGVAGAPAHRISVRPFLACRDRHSARALDPRRRVRHLRRHRRASSASRRGRRVASTASRERCTPRLLHTRPRRATTAVASLRPHVADEATAQVLPPPPFTRATARAPSMCRYGKSAFIAAATTNRKSAPKMEKNVQQIAQQPGPSAFFTTAGARLKIALYSSIQAAGGGGGLDMAAAEGRRARGACGYRRYA